MHKRRGTNCAGRAQRMAERNRAAERIHFAAVEIEFADDS